VRDWHTRSRIARVLVERFFIAGHRTNDVWIERRNPNASRIGRVVRFQSRSSVGLEFFDSFPS
jgi:hypothetical protein